MRIAVITPTIAGREKLLEECVSSVSRQTIREPFEHFIWLDAVGAGCGAMRNRVVADLDTLFDWLAFIDDDDVMLPRHLEALAAAAERADVVYSDCECVGWKKSWTTGPFDFVKLCERNYIPVTALVRRELFERLGGFGRCFAEDWDLWLRAASARARFAFVPEVTWQYRQLAGYPRMLRPL